MPLYTVQLALAIVGLACAVSGAPASDIEANMRAWVEAECDEGLL
jgi:hypothetical protein